MKAIFDTRSGSGYDDEVSQRYHFPNRYLLEAQRAIGDWIIYREPRRGGGREGYVAIARVVRIEADPAKSGHSYAWVGDYLAFDAVVPLRNGPGFYETMLDRIPNPAANRKIRDAAFRRTVCDAYDNRCAVTGLRIINGGGRAEVQAAHIWSVADGGPDVVQNGIALSGTVHWLFDRHLISLTDDLGLLMSHNKVPTELQALFGRHLARIHLPTEPRLWPHLAYVRRHREQFAAV